MNDIYNTYNYIHTHKRRCFCSGCRMNSTSRTLEDYILFTAKGYDYINGGIYFAFKTVKCKNRCIKADNGDYIIRKDNNVYLRICNFAHLQPNESINTEYVEEQIFMYIFNKMVANCFNHINYMPLASFVHCIMYSCIVFYMYERKYLLPNMVVQYSTVYREYFSNVSIPLDSIMLTNKMKINLKREFAFSKSHQERYVTETENDIEINNYLKCFSI